MRWTVVVTVTVAVLLCWTGAARGAEDEHRFSRRQAVPFVVNTVGPYSNPNEIYNFYSLPFCHPSQAKLTQHRHSSLGEDLEGDSISPALYDIRFRIDASWNPLCRVHLSRDDVKAFQHAVEHYYYFEWFFDGLPLRGFVGIPDFVIPAGAEELPFDGLPDAEVGRSALSLLPPRPSGHPQTTRHFIFRHLHFTILCVFFHFMFFFSIHSTHFFLLFFFPKRYNGDRIISANISADFEQVELIEGHDLTFEFSYSVAWHETELLYSDRMSLVDRDPNHGQELKIRWLGILNSSVLVVFLTGFVAVILFRVLKSDYTRYRRREHLKPGEDDDEPDDYGWKLVHGDIFRFPQHTLLFCSLLGVGAQFLVLALFSILLALSGIVSFYNPGGSAYTAALLLYSLTAVIAGLVSSYFFTQMEGQKWAWCVVLTSTLFSIPFFLLGVVLNLIAASYDSTSALSLGAIFLVVCIWLLVGFPLTLVGAIAGRHLAPPFEAPTRTNHFPRQIPEAPWYRRTAPMMVFAGFLPFSAIYIELYFIYYSVWGHHHYSLYGLLLLVFAILVTVTSCVTISLTYFQLAMEDHQWWWRSFLNGASTGLFIYGYSFYYYFFTSQMTGFLQASFFFVRMFLVSYIFWIMLGTVGFLASLKFVRQIYSNIKFA